MSRLPDHTSLLGAGRRLLVISKWVFGHEELAAPDTDSARRQPELNAVRWLIGRDELPRIATTERPPRRFIRWLLAREPVPTARVDHAPDTGSFLLWLLTADPRSSRAERTPDQGDLTR